MMLRIVFFLFAAAFLPSGFAQSSSSGSAPSSTSTSSSAPTQTVAVGAGGLVFTPNQLTADVGTIIEFWFYPQNHSVARSDYKSPCIPYEDTGINRQGFWSGFRPVSVVLSDPPKFQVRVNDTEPIFFYCSAPGACIDDGMIGVINANSTETFDTQLAYAKNATLMFSPGEYFPSEIVPTTSSSVPSATSTSFSTATAAPVATSTQSASSGHALTTGAIAGIAIGGAAVLVLGAALIYLCGRQRTMGELLQSQAKPVLPSYVPTNASMSSSATGSPPKIPQFDFNAAAPRRYSAQTPPPPAGFFDRSAADSESYRSRSPPFGEGREREFMIPSINIPRSPENMSPEGRQSPITRRPVPDSPLRPSPISPLGETMYMPLHMEPPPVQPPVNFGIPPGITRYDSQSGPHELAVESEPVYRAYNSENNSGP